MQKTRINNIDLAYRQFGKGDCDLLFVHGYMGRATCPKLYAQFFEELIPYFRITGLDLRGHGGSSDDRLGRGVSFRQLVNDVVAFVDMIGLKAPVCVGHSLGGLIGLACAVEKPDIFRGLIPITPAAAIGEKAQDPELLARVLKTHGDRTAMTAMFRSMYVRETSDVDLASSVDAACILDSAFNKKWVTVEWGKVNMMDDIGAVTMPTLFINGARDNVVAPSDQHKMAMSLPHCKEVVFTDEGHMLPVEAPIRAAREIIRFWKDEFEIDSCSHGEE